MGSEAKDMDKIDGRDGTSPSKIGLWVLFDDMMMNNWRGTRME